MDANNNGLRPRRSEINPAKGDNSATNRAGMVSATGTRMLTPGVSLKCDWIRGSKGASSTAPRIGKQLPRSNTKDCGVPAWRSVLIALRLSGQLIGCAAVLGRCLGLCPPEDSQGSSQWFHADTLLLLCISE